jgi:putative redox protein
LIVRLAVVTVEPMSVPAPVEAELLWKGDLSFEVRSRDAPFHLDGDSVTGPSPVKTLVAALAGCMAMDVVHVLTRARLPLTGLQVRIHARRAPEHPKRLVAVEMHFTVRGDVPLERVEHAIDLSRTTYCSVLHSLRPDLELTTAVTLAGA